MKGRECKRRIIWVQVRFFCLFFFPSRRQSILFDRRRRMGKLWRVTKGKEWWNVCPSNTSREGGTLTGLKGRKRKMTRNKVGFRLSIHSWWKRVRKLKKGNVALVTIIVSSSLSSYRHHHQHYEAVIDWVVCCNRRGRRSGRKDDRKKGYNQYKKEEIWAKVQREEEWQTRQRWTNNRWVKERKEGGGGSGWKYMFVEEKIKRKERGGKWEGMSRWKRERKEGRICIPGTGLV